MNKPPMTKIIDHELSLLELQIRELISEGQSQIEQHTLDREQTLGLITRLTECASCAGKNGLVFSEQLLRDIAAHLKRWLPTNT